MSEHTRVLWLTPDKPENISVGRQRIADHLEDQGMDVVLCETTLSTVFRSLRRIRSYDAIVGTTRAGAIAGSVLKIVGCRPLVVDHIDPIRQFRETYPWWLAKTVRILENLSFRLSDHTLFVYTEERKRVRQHASMTTCTDLGVEYGRFADPGSDLTNKIRNELEALSLEENVAVYIGGLEPVYHIRELVEAVMTIEGWSLIILGDGSLASYVQSVASDQNDIVYLGTTSHEKIPGYLRFTDVGVSLVNDPHTLKILEYGAAGLPVVQLDGEARKRFGDFLVYCDSNPESIARAIQEAAERDEVADLSSFVSNFDWSHIAEDYYKAIESVL